MTTPNDVLSFLKCTITEIKDLNEDDILMESTLEEIGLDSLDYVEIQLAVKKQYGAEVSQDTFMEGRIKTIGDFCVFVSTSELLAEPVIALGGAAE